MENFKAPQKLISWKQGSYEHQSISRGFLIVMKSLSSLLNKLYLKNFILSHCNIKEHKVILVSISGLSPLETFLNWYWQTTLIHLTNVLTIFPFETLADLSPQGGNKLVKGCLPFQYTHGCTLYISLHAYPLFFSIFYLLSQKLKSKAEARGCYLEIHQHCLKNL